MLNYFYSFLLSLPSRVIRSLLDSGLQPTDFVAIFLLIVIFFYMFTVHFQIVRKSDNSVIDFTWTSLFGVPEIQKIQLPRETKNAQRRDLIRRFPFHPDGYRPVPWYDIPFL